MIDLFKSNGSSPPESVFYTWEKCASERDDPWQDDGGEGIEQVWPPLHAGPPVWFPSPLWDSWHHCQKCFERALAAEV
jgi:hypothetical protein